MRTERLCHAYQHFRLPEMKIQRHEVCDIAVWQMEVHTIWLMDCIDKEEACSMQAVFQFRR
jgi:hypothetical protein